MVIQVQQVLVLVNSITLDLCEDQLEDFDLDEGCAFIQALTFRVKAAQQLPPADTRSVLYIGTALFQQCIITHCAFETMNSPV